MNNWKYYELIAHYYSSFFSCLEQNRSTEMAIATTFESYYFYPKEANVIVNLVAIIQNIKLQIALLKSVNNISIDLFRTQLTIIDYTLLSTEMEPNEIDHLNETIAEIEQKLKTVIVQDSTN